MIHIVLIISRCYSLIFVPKVPLFLHFPLTMQAIEKLCLDVLDDFHSEVQELSSRKLLILKKKNQFGYMCGRRSVNYSLDLFDSTLSLLTTNPRKSKFSMKKHFPPFTVRLRSFNSHSIS